MSEERRLIEKGANDLKKVDEIDVDNLPVKAVDQQASFFASIERLASNPNVDVDKIKQIMEMQEHVLERNAKQSFNASMMQTQGKIELVVAKSKNSQTGSKYADLQQILIKTKPVYTAEGFSLMFYEGETTKENHKRVCVDIMHEQGHTEQRYGDFAIQTTGIAGKTMMTQIHGEGSAFSYGRRYLTCMIFNIPTGDDDDGNAAGKNIEYVNEKQLSSMVDMINSKNVNKAKFLKYMGVESLDKIPSSEFGRAIEVLKKSKGEKKTGREPGDDDK